MKIDVYFDTICPWCWIGKHNLEKALEIWEGDKIEVTYKSFFLDETIPEDGVPSKGRLQKKYGMTDQQLKEYLDRLFQHGRESDIEFNYDIIKIIPNTIFSHVLINMVKTEQKSKLIERIFYDFFNKGRNIGSIKILESIAKDFDISTKDFAQNLTDKKKREKVINEVYTARIIGVQSVPFYIINDKYTISGAQKPEIIVQALDNVKMKENSIELI